MWYVCFIDITLLFIYEVDLFNHDVDYFQCANHYNVDIQKAKDCKKSRSTVEILEKYGNETSKIHASFIPAIGIGNVSIIFIMSLWLSIL